MQKRTVKKRTVTAAMFLSMALILCLSACAARSAEPNPSVNAPSQSSATDDMSVTRTLSYYSFWMATMQHDSELQKDIEEKLNVKLELSTVDHMNQDQVALMFAADTLPDFGLYTRNTNFMYYQNELSRTIPLAYLQEYAPSFVDIYNEYPISWAVITCKENPEELYCLPPISESSTMKLYPEVDYYRYDWLLEFGTDLGVKVEQISDTLYIAENGIKLDKYEEILQAFLQKGNAPATWGWYIIPPQLLGAFGIIEGVNDNGGKAEFHYTMDQYKECLKYVQKLYKQDLIDKEFLTNTSAQWWEKVMNGYTGWQVGSANWLNGWANARPPRTMIDNGIPMMMTPGVADMNGVHVTGASVLPFWGNPQNIFINRKIDDATLIRILKVLEYGYFWEGDTDKQLRMIFGEKGVDWVMDPDRPEYPKLINSLTSGDKGKDLFIGMQVRWQWKWLTIEPLFEKGAKYYLQDYGGLWNKNMALPYKHDILNETDLVQVNGEIGTTIDTLMKEYSVDAIIGNIDIDATWDGYVSNLYSAGYQRILDEIEKTPVITEVIAKYSK